MRVGVTLTVLIAASGLAGCNAPEAKFVSSEETNALVRDAREVVESAVLESFGTPHKLVGWEKLPTEYRKRIESDLSGSRRR